MPFSHEKPASRMERARCAVRDRTSGAAQTVSEAAGTAQSAAMQAAGVAQGTAVQVADRANVVAQQVADRASVAAAVMAERARPVAAEAAARGGAAWQAIRYGAPQPSPMTRIASVMPVAVVTSARRGRAPLGLMVLGAAGAVGLLWWRRSRSNADSVWILDTDTDVEPVGRWQERDSRASADDTMESGRRESPANRWP
ncbi:hypothetical protein [Catenulispora sp. GP43]|uniref:hypothetical protein n=1 Tax=Catenulispora sp. GP43 TaxID=3156263 RepID=UPI00351851B4